MTAAEHAEQMLRVYDHATALRIAQHGETIAPTRARKKYWRDVAAAVEAARPTTEGTR